jgi:hypothetical protein
MVPVKFEGEPSIPFLIKKQLFAKEGGPKFTFSKQFQFSKYFKSRHLQKDKPSPIFLGLDFSCERDRQPSIKFDIDSEVPFVYRLIPRKLGFLE